MIANVAQRRLVDARAALPPPARLLLAALGVMNLGVLVPLPALRAMVTLPLALLVPGYAVMMAVFGHRPRRDAPLTLAFTVLLSMATYPLVALALSAAAIPIRTGSVMLSTDGLVALLVAVAVLRTRRERRTTDVSVVPIVTATGLNMRVKSPVPAPMSRSGRRSRGRTRAMCSRQGSRLSMGTPRPA